MDGYELINTRQTGILTTITNRHIPGKIDVSGTKTWDDEDDRDGLRPDSVTIRLLADGTEVAVFTLNADNEWYWRYEAQKYAGGKEIAYTITEDEVKNYMSSIDGFNVTNTVVPPTGNHFNMIAPFAALAVSVIACAVLFFLVRRCRKG